MVEDPSSYFYAGNATVGIHDTGGHLNGRVLQWSPGQPIISDGDAILLSTNAVPEPATWLLAGAGFAWLCAFRRRRS